MKDEPTIKTILYATDLGENTRPVFRTALSLAKAYNATIIMVHVVEPMSSSLIAVVDTYLSEVDAKKIYQDNMQSVLESMKVRLQKYCEEEHGSQKASTLPISEMIVLSGRTSEEILKTAEKKKADMIVLGKSTKKLFGEHVAGSAARRVSRHSRVPVVIVPNI